VLLKKACGAILYREIDPHPDFFKEKALYIIHFTNTIESTAASYKMEL